MYLKETNDLISEVSFETPSSGDTMNLVSYPFIPGSRQFDPEKHKISLTDVKTRRLKRWE